MDDFKLLTQLFDNKLIASSDGDYGKPCLELQERTNDNSYVLTIQNVPKNTVAIKTDSFPDLRDFFKCSSEIGQCKRSDFAIISDTKLIFIELSSSKKQQKEVMQQLKGAQCVLEYCKSISDKFYKHNSLFENYESYFVSIYNVGGNKRSNITPSGANNNVNNFLKINAPNNLQFNKLISKK